MCHRFIVNCNPSGNFVVFAKVSKVKAMALSVYNRDDQVELWLS